jgi:GNAT superfamily N-acetyltransferase
VTAHQKGVAPSLSALVDDAEMDEVSVRRARHGDSDAIADVFLTSFAATYRFPLAHSDEQVRRWIPEILIPTEEVWVVTDPDVAVVAMMALSSEMLDQLYVAPAWTGRRIGSRLIELAKSRRPGGLDLYTFQVNAGARRFYERHGFVEVWRGDGSDNDEGQPDLRYAWRPSSQAMASGHNRPSR